MSELITLSLIKFQMMNYIKKSIPRYKYKADLKLLFELKKIIGEEVFDLIEKPKSQYNQEILYLYESSFKRNGFFVELVASDGIRHSNSFLLENVYGYKGILSEPSIFQSKDLKYNRNNIIDKRCVWSKTGEKLLFADCGDLSTIANYINSDHHKNSSMKNESYHVETVSLTDLLILHKAPNIIDFLSIDTEGSEFEILNAHDFNRFKFRYITFKHNHTENREKIKKLLIKKGYIIKYQKVTQNDDFYILNEPSK